MRILFDLYTTQIQIGGSAEYVRRVFYSLIDYAKNNCADIEIIGLVDSSLNKWSYKDLTPNVLTQNGINIADYASSSLSDIICRYDINLVFIGCAQFWGERFDVQNISCSCVCVIHDLQDEEFCKNKINEYLYLYDYKKLCKYILSRLLLGNRSMRIPPIIKSANNNPQIQLITVSQYSKQSILYNYNIESERIMVLYSPERIINKTENVLDSNNVDYLINNNIRYYLLLSSNRPIKNARKVLKAFERYQRKSQKDVYIVTTGGIGKQFERHIPMPYLTDYELDLVMKNCYALIFASFFEGFGYPAVEAMKYGKPVLASNVTSIPEILGNAPIYFSPIYESDIFSALSKLSDDEYDSYTNKSLERYHSIRERQEADLETLLKLITNTK